METPRNLRQRPARNPTPRLSERKKSLFATDSEVIEINSDSEQENCSYDGLVALNNNNDKMKNTNAQMRSVEVLLSRTPQRISFLSNNNHFSPERMDDDVFEKLPESPPASKENAITSPLRRSRRLSLKPKNRSPTSTITSPSTSKVVNGKENKPATPQQKGFSDELPTLFTNSMNLNRSKKVSEEEVIEESSSEDGSIPPTLGTKRNHLTSGGTAPSPEAKIRRLDMPERRSISTKSFYSRAKTSPALKSPPTTVIVKRSPKHKRPDHKRSPGLMINKGVRHNIKRKPNHKPYTAVTATKANVMEILGTIRNEKLRKLLTDKRQEKDQIENVHRIFKSAKNPIEMAKPLSMIVSSYSSTGDVNNDGNNNAPVASNRCYMNGIGDMSLGFSDIDCSSDSEADLEDAVTQQDVSGVIEAPETRTPTPVPGRKFFKSGNSTTKKEFKVTDNIKASVCNGKLSIMHETKKIKKKIKRRSSIVNEFSSEQARVEEILKNFDISLIAPAAEDEVEVPVNHINQIESARPTATFATEDYGAFEQEMRMPGTEEDSDCHEFRRRLPYNTSDPELIEQQHILLDFLITNKICTEQNFAIFIADPENHKEEAQKIVDQLVVVLGESPDTYRQQIPYNTTDPMEIDRQRNFLEFLVENNLCNEENFQIFIADYANRHEEADRIITDIVATTHNISAEDLERELNKFNKQSSECMELEIPDQNKQNQKALDASTEKLFPIFYPGHCQPIVQQKSSRRPCRTWNAGMGLNQYQIDAGQKQFGARQCKQCGLIYTVHEPEEEKLHKEFHASQYILKFKSWIDEDIVQIYPEWGGDGRILRITEKSHMKRQERLRDVLKLVDKELGFSSYILPSSFKAYFAVRQSQIVGVCLAQPLTNAHRYISMNGVDCCTEETFEAKCGISRIWVSPLHRRFHIASKLIRAVQLYTIFSEEIPLDKIAFSAPTEEGKKFAKSVTKMENFLVYQ